MENFGALFAPFWTFTVNVGEFDHCAEETCEAGLVSGSSLEQRKERSDWIMRNFAGFENDDVWIWKGGRQHYVSSREL